MHEYKLLSNVFEKVSIEIYSYQLSPTRTDLQTVIIDKLKFTLICYSFTVSQHLLLIFQFKSHQLIDRSLVSLAQEHHWHGSNPSFL